MASQSLHSATLARTNVASPPAPRTARTASDPARSSTSVITTFAPSPAKSCAAARPIPLPAPVISATLPSSRPVTMPAFRSRLGLVLPRPVDDLGLERVGVARVGACALLQDPVVHLVGDRL